MLTARFRCRSLTVTVLWAASHYAGSNFVWRVYCFVWEMRMFDDFGRRQLLKRAGLALISASGISAQKSASKPVDCNCAVADDGTPLDTGTSELRPVIERYSVELRDFERVYSVPGSPARQAALEKFYAAQLRL